MERSLSRLSKPFTHLWATHIFALLSLVSLAKQPLIISWQTTATNESTSTTIPVNPDEPTYYYTIDWYKGIIETDQTGDVTHTYANPGISTVAFTESFTAINLTSESSHEQRSKTPVYRTIGCSGLALFRVMMATKCSNPVRLTSDFLKSIS